MDRAPIFLPKGLALLAAAAALALSGCAGADGRYPSLARRPIEGTFDPATGQFSPLASAPAPVPPLAGDPPIAPLDSPARIAAALSTADRSHRAFLDEAAEAARLVRAAARRERENPVHARAVVMLSSLSARRAATLGSLAELDRLAAEAAVALAPLASAEAARARVLALAEAENAALARLWGELGE